MESTVSVKHGGIFYVLRMHTKWKRLARHFFCGAKTLIFLKQSMQLKELF